MLKRLFTFVLGAAFGAAVMYFALQYHVVRATDGLHLVGKVDANLSDIYVDIRDFDLADWEAHPNLVVNLSASGKSHLLSQSAMGIIEKAGRQLWNLPAE